MATEVAQAAAPDESFRASFTRLEPEFTAALPPHMPVDRFMRVVLTAVNGNPELLQADRRSLFEAAMKAAQDGLLPDGREGALVIYNTKLPKQNGQDREQWIKKVQWMPMIAGILKRVRNSGELKTIVARVVYGGDKYRHWIDDDGEHIEYEAAEGDAQDRNIFRKVFAMAKLKDGSIEVEEMTPADIDKVRNASKAKSGPAWTIWEEEMKKKSALRRLSKRLPISSDLDDLIRRDDDLYDFSAKPGDMPAGFEAVKNLRDDQRVVDHRPGQTFDAGAGREGDTVDAGRGDGAEEMRGSSQAQADQATGPGKDREAAQEDRISSGRQSSGKPDDAGSGAQAQEGARPAEASRTAAATNQRPYEMDAKSYMGFMRDEFDKATVGAVVDDLWGSTRKDRQELLSDGSMSTEQLAELEADKKAKITALKLRRDKA